MIQGLPWTSWLLLILAVGLGLALSLTFYLVHRQELSPDGGGSAPAGSGPGVDPRPGANADDPT